MVMEYKYGKMEIDMREFGRMEKLMEKENLLMPKMNILKAILLIIKQMAMENSYNPMGVSMRAKLKIIYNTEKVKKLNQMAQFI